MADPMVDLWKDTAIKFNQKVLKYLEKEDIQEQDRKKIERIRDVMSGFIQDTKKPSTLYTQDNLVLLVKCWNDLCMWTLGTQYWHKEFPEWSFMISQFQIFVNEFEMKEIRELLHTTGGVDLPTGRRTTRMSELLELMRVG
jgi:hypothetical protein